MFARLAAVERRWAGAANSSPGAIGFLPFPMARFVTFLTDAVAAASGNWFLDIGAGPGSKCILAAALYDLEAHGIEIDPAMVTAAQENGAQVIQADALTFAGYGDYDILYLNRPAPGALGAELEQRIMAAAKPGAVLVAVNATGHPSWGCGWEPVCVEWDESSWVWRKLPVHS